MSLPSAAPSRDARIDTLRGLAILVMAARHADLPVRDVVWRPLGYASFAQVFVLLSGIVTGMVWLRLRETRGDAALRRTAWRRAAALWIVHVGLLVYLAFLVRIGSDAGAPWTPRRGRLMLEDPLEAIALGAAFLWQPVFFDILPMYCAFLVVTPYAIASLAEGGRRATAVLAGSVVLWTSAQTGLLERLASRVESRLPVVVPAFDPLAWQLLFVAGLWLGVRRARGLQFPLPRTRLAAVGTAALLAVVFVAQLVVARARGGERRADEDSAWIFRREALGPVSVVAFAAVAYGTAWIGARRPSLLVARPLAFLGRHALLVFAFHLLVVLPTWILPPLESVSSSVLTVVVLASLFVPAALAERRGARRRASRASSPDPSADVSADPSAASSPASPTPPRESCSPGPPG